MTLEDSTLIYQRLNEERSHITDCTMLADDAATNPTSSTVVGTEVTAEILLARARALQFVGRNEDARRDCLDARRVAESAGALSMATDAEMRLASIALEASDLELAARHIENAARLSGRLGCPEDDGALAYLDIGHAPAANQNVYPKTVPPPADVAKSSQIIGSLFVGPGGMWFRLGLGNKIDLRRRRSARLILQALVQHRIERPGEVVSVEALVAKGWPGEAMQPSSARSRLYVTVLGLRNRGLRHVLLAQDGGYLLDPDLEVLAA